MAATIKTSASKFKAKLGQYMKAVRAGKEVVVTDWDQPVAKLVPIREREATGLVIWRARDPGAPPLGQLTGARIGYRGTNTTAMLLEDRRR